MVAARGGQDDLGWPGLSQGSRKEPRWRPGTRRDGGAGGEGSLEAQEGRAVDQGWHDRPRAAAMRMPRARLSLARAGFRLATGGSGSAGDAHGWRGPSQGIAEDWDLGQGRARGVLVLLCGP